MIRPFCAGVLVGVAVCGTLMAAIERRNAKRVSSSPSKKPSVVEEFYKLWGIEINDHVRGNLLRAMDESRVAAKQAVRAAQESSANSSKE